MSFSFYFPTKDFIFLWGFGPRRVWGGRGGTSMDSERVSAALQQGEKGGWKDDGKQKPNQGQNQAWKRALIFDTWCFSFFPPSLPFLSFTLTHTLGSQGNWCAAFDGKERPILRAKRPWWKSRKKERKWLENVLLKKKERMATHDKSGWRDGNQTWWRLRVWWLNGSGGKAKVDGELTVLAQRWWWLRLAWSFQCVMLVVILLECGEWMRSLHARGSSGRLGGLDASGRPIAGAVAIFVPLLSWISSPASSSLPLAFDRASLPCSLPYDIITQRYRQASKKHRAGLRICRSVHLKEV